MLKNLLGHFARNMKRGRAPCLVGYSWKITQIASCAKQPPITQGNKGGAKVDQLTVDLVIAKKDSESPYASCLQTR